MSILKKLVGLVLIIGGCLSGAFFAFGTILCITGEVDGSGGVTLFFAIITVICILIARFGAKLFKQPKGQHDFNSNIVKPVDAPAPTSMQIDYEPEVETEPIPRPEPEPVRDTESNSSSIFDNSFFDIPDVSSIPDNTTVEKTYKKSSGSSIRIKVKVGGSDSPKMVVVECEGCGAPAQIEKGSIGKCEYCGSYIQG